MHSAQSMNSKPASRKALSTHPRLTVPASVSASCFPVAALKISAASAFGTQRTPRIRSPGSITVPLMAIRHSGRRRRQRKVHLVDDAAVAVLTRTAYFFRQAKPAASIRSRVAAVSGQWMLNTSSDGSMASTSSAEAAIQRIRQGGMVPGVSPRVSQRHEEGEQRADTVCAHHPLSLAVHTSASEPIKPVTDRSLMRRLEQSFPRAF